MHAIKAVLGNSGVFNVVIILNNLYRLNIYDTLRQVEK